MTEEITQDEIKFTEEQQKFIDKRIGQARMKAKEKAIAEAKTAQDDAAKAAEQAKLAAEAEWKKLADMHADRVKELEPFEAQAKAYTELITGMLKDRIKVLGDLAKKAVEALPAGMSALEKLDWLNKNQELFGTESVKVGSPAKKIKAQTTDKSPKDLGHRRLRM